MGGGSKEKRVRASDEKREALILSLTMDNGGNHRRNTFHFLSLFIFFVSSVDTRFLSRERRESAACFFPRSNRNEFFQEEREQGGKERKKGKKENLTEIRKCSYATPSLPTF